MNFTNPVRTVSGATLQIYRDSFDLQFANLSLDRQGHIREFDPSAIGQNAGIEVAGMVGFDILHRWWMHMDYRDGLVKFDSPASGPARTTVLSSQTAIPSASSSKGGQLELQLSMRTKTAIIPSTPLSGEASSAGWTRDTSRWASRSMSKFSGDWIAPSCTLIAGATLYGHVLAASASKRASELSLVFDHGDCSGHPKQELSLRIIGVAGGDAQYQAVHNAMPTQVAGGGGPSPTPLHPWASPRTTI